MQAAITLASALLLYAGGEQPSWIRSPKTPPLHSAPTLPRQSRHIAGIWSAWPAAVTPGVDLRSALPGWVWDEPALAAAEQKLTTPDGPQPRAGRRSYWSFPFLLASSLANLLAN